MMIKLRYFQGYIFVFLNNTFTMANAVYTKKKLNSKELGKLCSFEICTARKKSIFHSGKYGLMFYNALFMSVPCILAILYTDDIQEIIDFKGWQDPTFCFKFFLSCIFGFILVKLLLKIMSTD